MKYLFASFCISILIITVGCSSDSEDCPPGQIIFPNQQVRVDGEAYKQSALDCRLPKLQTFRFNNYLGAQIIASKGTIFFIGQGAFTTMDGTPIDDAISFSVLEMYDAGEIIACQLSTNGVNRELAIEPLLSESIFYISAEYNGEPLRLNGEVQVFIPSKNENLELSVFNSPSCPELECQVLWEAIPQTTVFEEAYEDAAGNIITGYRSFINKLGWHSIARYNPAMEEPGILYNKALPQFSMENSNVFLMYNSKSIAIGMYSEFDSSNEVFSEKYGEIPKNTTANVIFVSKPDNLFSFDSSPILAENGKITITRDLKNGSENILIDYINNL